MPASQLAAVGAELGAKLILLRAELAARELTAIRLRGSDWFAWLTCGGSSVVDTSSEAGVAELLVTATDALVLADRIDALRLSTEEVSPQLSVVELPWAARDARDAKVSSLLGHGARVASDRPRADEAPLPTGVAHARLRLLPAEIDRFREVGTQAARALTVTLRDVRPDMTEARVAAMVADELIGRGLWPLVILVGGARRLPLFRHPTARQDQRIGDRAMVVVCARRHGLIANLTRHVYFRPPSAAERANARVVADVEGAAFSASVRGRTLGEVYRVIADAYASAGFGGAESDHHQGGLAGYRTREEVATPLSTTVIDEGSALAWNPSLPGSKLEDTVVVTASGLEVLTLDPSWPATVVQGRSRPDVLVLD